MSTGNMEEFDEGTQQILMQGMSAMAAQQSMGLVNRELAETMRQESEQLAEDMTRKNKENQRRRAAAVAGGEEALLKSEVEQKKVKGRRKKGMVRQEPAVPPEMPRQIAPAPSLPEPQEIPAGLTAQDMDLIRQVKASRARMRDNFLSANDTVHPGAVDASYLRPQVQLPTQQPAVESSTVDSSTFVPNSAAGIQASSNPGFAYVRMREEQVTPVQDPARQEMVIHNDLHSAAYNGQGNPNYGQVGSYQNQQPILQPPTFAPVVDPNIFTEMARNPQPPQLQPEAPAPEARPDYRRAEQVAVRAPVNPEQPFAENGPAFDPKTLGSFSEIRWWPSHGVAYPDKIYAQAFVTDDIFMMSDMDNEDTISTLTTILGQRIRGISPEDILSADEPYLLHWLRASTYNEKENGLPRIKFTCGNCNTTFDTPESVSMMEPITFFDLDFKPVSSPEEIFALHSEKGYAEVECYDGRECDVYLRRRKHDRIVADYIKKWEEANHKTFPRHRLTAAGIAAFVEIEDCETMTDKIDFIGQYPPAYKNAWFKAIYDTQIETAITLKMTCPRCGGTVVVPYKFRYPRYVASLQ